MPTNYAQGHHAEQVAADYVKSRGYRVLATNWKTKWCEIDIIAEMEDCIYFIEVKYRKNNKQGRGLDYVTPKKLHQMQFSAEIWVHNHGWLGEYQLGAIELTGDDFRVSAFITE